MAEMIARFKPGQNIPAFCTAQVEAGRFLKITGNKTTNGDYSAAHAGAGEYAFGVSERNSGPTTDPATSWTRRVNVVRRGAVARVESGAAIAAGDPIKSDATGRAIPQAGSGVILGYAMSHVTAAAQVVEVDLI
jgi:hypothetical protein